jgi:hypothetical protein
MKELTLFDYHHMIHAIISRLPTDGRKGLPGVQFTMDVRHPDVEMADRIRDRFDQEITLILQMRYWDLDVRNDRFSVLLTFNNQYETIVVPLAAIVDFIDFETGLRVTSRPVVAEKPAENTNPVSPPLSLVEEAPAPEEATSNVVSLSNWRKRR